MRYFIEDWLHGGICGAGPFCYEQHGRNGHTAPDFFWFGVTAENQEQADKRIPELLKIPAAVRLVSVEPMLERITLNYLHYKNTVEIDSLNGTHGVLRPHKGKNSRINLVICGAETGNGARYMQPEWAYDLYDQCHAAGVPFFFKTASRGDTIHLPREHPKCTKWS